MHRCVKKEAMTGNSVENCAHWFRFQISANSFVNFFTKLVAKWWKCKN